MKSYWTSLDCQNSMMILLEEPPSPIEEITGILLLILTELITLIEPSSEEEPFSRAFSLMKALPNSRAAVSTLGLQPKHHSKSFTELPLGATAIKNRSRHTLRICEVPKMNFTSVVNRRKTVMLMNGRPKLLTIQCPLVIRWVLWLICLTISRTQISTKPMQRTDSTPHLKTYVGEMVVKYRQKILLYRVQLSFNLDDLLDMAIQLTVNHSNGAQIQQQWIFERCLWDQVR